MVYLIFGLVLGVILSMLGYNYTTWQFWVLAVVVGIILSFVTSRL